jgi:hypothetical protein
MTVSRRMLVGMRPKNDPSPEDLINAPWPGEIQMNVNADTGHILHHTGIDEPSGTWTGGACARHRRPPGSDVALADLGEMHRQSGGLVDVTWYPEPVASDGYLQLLREWREDGARQPHRHPFDWWAGRAEAMWSYIWAANCRYVAEIIEKPVRDRGGAGFLIASFEHNSSDHALERPHVHNLMPQKRDAARRSTGTTVTMTEGYGAPSWPGR